MLFAWHYIVRKCLAHKVTMSFKYIYSVLMCRTNGFQNGNNQKCNTCKNNKRNLPCSLMHQHSNSHNPSHSFLLCFTFQFIFCFLTSFDMLTCNWCIRQSMFSISNEWIHLKYSIYHVFLVIIYYSLNSMNGEKWNESFQKTWDKFPFQ